MSKIPFTEDSFKTFVTHPIVKPRIIALVGWDVYQISQFKALLLQKFCRNQALHSFNVDYVDKSNVSRLSKEVYARIDSLAREVPISADFRLVIIDYPAIQISLSSVPQSSIILYINPANPDKAEVIFSVYPLYGRRLKAFVRSTVKSFEPLQKFFSTAKDIDFLVENLYFGNTQAFCQEITKLQKLATAYPLDFLPKARQYIADFADARQSTIYRLLRNNSQSELVELIYKSVFVEAVLEPIQVFNILSQHFFVNVFLEASKLLKQVINLPEDEDYVFSYLNSNVVYDSVFNSCVLVPASYQTTFSCVPSLSLEVRPCSGSSVCGTENYCTLTSKSFTRLGLAIGQAALHLSHFCPLSAPIFRDSMNNPENIKKFSNSWLYLLSSDKTYLSDSPPKFFSPKPLGVMVLKPSRHFSLSDIQKGAELFQKSELLIKLGGRTEFEQMVILFSLVSYLMKNVILQDFEVLARGEVDFDHFVPAF